MKININKIISFFDEGNGRGSGDVSSIIGLIGEDLNSAVFKYYLESCKHKVEILDSRVVQGFKGGKWLDRWIVDHTDKIIYQCEIKNWSSTAISGRELRLDANDNEKKIVSEYNQVKEIKNNFVNRVKQPTGVTKVLLKMKVPHEYEQYEVLPLVIYWMPVSFSQNVLDFYSQLDVKKINLNLDTNFSILKVFSVSLYLRTLSGNYININLPNFSRRMNLLGDILN